jgi:Lipocalin-like domain
MKEKLVGTWKLKSFLIETNGQKREWRHGAHGFLIYSKEGFVSVSINSLSKSNDDLFESILFYAGKFEVNENKILHFVTNATDIHRIDKIMERDISLDGNLLNIIGKGDFGSADLQWEKVIS